MCDYYDPFGTALHFMLRAFFPVHFPPLIIGTQTPDAFFRNHWLLGSIYNPFELYCVKLWLSLFTFIIKPLWLGSCALGLTSCPTWDIQPLLPSQLQWNLSSIDNYEDCEAALELHYGWAAIRAGCLLLTLLIVLVGFELDKLTSVNHKRIK